VDAVPGIDARRRRRILWAGLVPSAICAALALYRPEALTRFDLDVYDALLRAAGPDHASGDVIIVAVDERSLSAFGQWPWRRDVVATLVTRLRDMGSRAIAFDIVFAEPDRERRIPGDERRSRHGAHEGALAPDEALANALRQGRVITSYALTFGSAAGGSARCVLHPMRIRVTPPFGEAAHLPLFRASDVLCSLPALTEASAGSGFLNAAPDPDGILRRVPMVLELDGRVYPALALAAIASSDPMAAELRVANVNRMSLVMGDLVLPLDGKGNLLLRYRGPEGTFPQLSAADVLAGVVPATTFQDKIVFVGVTALGTQELVATPFDASFAGVEVHATVADNLLRRDFIRRPAHASAVEALSTLAGGAGIALLIARVGLLGGGLAAVALLAWLWAMAGWLLDLDGVFLSPVIPMGGALVSVAAASGARFADELRGALARLQRARRDTEEARRAGNEFLMTVTHELRTPLTAIYGYVQLLARGALRSDRKDHALATIERNARRQTQVIQDLIDASQSMAGTLRLDVNGVDLAEVVRSVADAVRPAIEARRLTLGLMLDPLEPVRGDRDRLQQVVLILLSNAIKFTPESGRIDVCLERDASCAQLTVTDTGCGIAPASLPHVFDPFWQQDAGTTRRHGGVGLGLTLARYIVELHGGTIEVDSRGEGQGATFRIRIPLEAPAVSGTVAHAPTIRGTPLAGIRVLVVDDELEARSSLASVLLEADASVLTAASARDARAILDGSPQEVLVVSLDLPFDEGDRLVQEAAATALSRQERLTIITVSGAGCSADEARTRAPAVDLHLNKPVEPARLVSAIAALSGDHGR
jgi:signal transduction histidine kinase